jgi:YggT family protein
MFIAVVQIALVVLRIVQFLVLGAVIASWLSADSRNFIVRVLRETTEPLFRRVRPLARKIPGPLDWSPMIVLLAIEFVKIVLFRLAVALS